MTEGVTLRLSQHEAAPVVEKYGGDAAAVWRIAADGKELPARLQALPGFGPEKARIFLALLGKRLGVTPPGWREAADPYSVEGVYRSVADVTGPDSLAAVRADKQQRRAAVKAGAATSAPAPSRRAKASGDHQPGPSQPLERQLATRAAPGGER